LCGIIARVISMDETNISSINKLWIDYKNSNCHALKEALIIHYAPLVKYVAGRLFAHTYSHVDMDDLIGYGVFGLIDAIDKFEHGMGAKFETYAALRIRGEILDQIRTLDWVPRTQRRHNNEMIDVCNKLEEELGREPTVAEIAQALSITVAQAQELISKSSVISLISWDDYLDANGETALVSSPNDSETLPEASLEQKETMQLLADALENLDERERLLITLYYYEFLNVREIAEVMQISASRVSQLHTRALRKLQTKLGKYRFLLFNS